MSEPKFCKDCKHFNHAGSLGFYGVGVSWPDSCSQPPERELIHGRRTPAIPSRMRSDEGACKPEALLWEEKPPTLPPVPTTIPSYMRQEPAQSTAIIPIHQQAARWWEFWK